MASPEKGGADWRAVDAKDKKAYRITGFDKNAGKKCVWLGVPREEIKERPVKPPAKKLAI